MVTYEQEANKHTSRVNQDSHIWGLREDVVVDGDHAGPGNSVIEGGIADTVGPVGGSSMDGLLYIGTLVKVS